MSQVALVLGFLLGVAFVVALRWPRWYRGTPSWDDCPRQHVAIKQVHDTVKPTVDEALRIAETDTKLRRSRGEVVWDYWRESSSE